MKKTILLFSAICFLQTINLTLSAQTASVTCPGNKTVATDKGICTAVVNNIDPVVSPSTATVYYSITYNGITELGTGNVSGKSFNRGVSTVKYYLPDYPDVFCSFTITVEDHEPPVISCPPNMTVVCAKDVPPVYGGPTATAIDNCTATELIEVKFVSEEKTNQTCFNRYTLTRTFKATDAAGNSSSCSQIITVNDNEAPYFLLPPPVSPLTVSCSFDVPPAYPDGYKAYDDCSPEGEDEVEVKFKETKSDSLCPNKYKLTRTWTAIDLCGNQTVYTQIINVDDKSAPEFDAFPISTSVSCVSDIPVAPVLTAKDHCTGGTATIQMNEARSEEECTNKFKLTRTWTATDACGNTSTVSQVIIVNDTQAPVFDGTPPSDVRVSCAKDIPAAATQTASDNCGATATINFSEVKSNVECTNRFTLTRTWVATDECGNSATRTQVINVYDNEAPKVTGISADPVVLWPPNHKMRDVTINYTATDNCEVTSTLSVTSSDPVNGGSDGDQSPDWEVIDGHHVKLRAEKANNGQARYYTIAIHITDGCNTPVDTTVTVVVAHNITAPQTGHPYKVGSTVSLNGVFWDKPGNTHTAKWLLDGSAAANGSVTETSGNQNGKISGSYKFNTPGVYKLQMNVTDQNGITSYANTNNDLDAIVVIYDPNGSNAFGGGWFTSPTGALTSDTSATGKASYGFSVNYRNAAKPKGETQFEFKVGSFEFNALNFDYLSVNGAKAQFRGTGKIIGGQSGIGFIMTVKDGAIDGSNIDRIRMKIYNRNTGYVYYDNQPGAGDADEPATVIGTNSEIVIQESATSAASAISQETMEINTPEKITEQLKLIAFPNPSNKDFTIQVKTNDLKTIIQMLVFDQQGRLLEKRDRMAVGSLIKFGEKFRPGIYYIRIVQGLQHGELKLVKLSE